MQNVKSHIQNFYITYIHKHEKKSSQRSQPLRSNIESKGNNTTLKIRLNKEAIIFKLQAYILFPRYESHRNRMNINQVPLKVSVALIMLMTPVINFSHSQDPAVHCARFQRIVLQVVLFLERGAGTQQERSSSNSRFSNTRKRVTMINEIDFRRGGGFEHTPQGTSYAL